jgi:hypothetical protein
MLSIKYHFWYERHYVSDHMTTRQCIHLLIIPNNNLKIIPRLVFSINWHILISFWFQTIIILNMANVLGFACDGVQICFCQRFWFV